MAGSCTVDIPLGGDLTSSPSALPAMAGFRENNNRETLLFSLVRGTKMAAVFMRACGQRQMRGSVMRHVLSRRTFGLGAAGAMFAISSGSRRAAAKTPPIKLGVLLPRSGFQAFFGQGCQRGFEVALPILHDMGYSLELLSGDTESKP